MAPGTKHDSSPIFGRRLREARDLAGIPQDKLGVPLAFLYCDDDVLARILLLAHKMPKEARRALLASMQ